MESILWAGLIALIVTIVGTRPFISFLQRRHFGQPEREDGVSSHLAKRGTPTMGGIVIIAAVLVAYAGAHLISRQPPSISALLVLSVLVATGALGFFDDWAKINQQQSGGMRPRVKLIGQIIIGGTFGLLALNFPNPHGVTAASQSVSFIRDIDWPLLRLPLVVAIIWMTFLITSFSNAVNLTDGVDGLATGCSAMVFAAYGMINVWQRSQWCGWELATQPTCYEARNPYDLALVSIALAAACFGFLWWNAKPARIILGDTGSLSMGATMGALAICTRTELLLPILGALFVVETLSVALQVGWFKLSKGKRIFKMAPLHHHFEMLGWEEQTVAVRFWVLCGIAVAVGFGLFYAEWVLST